MASEEANSVAGREGKDIVISELSPLRSSYTFTKELCEEPNQTSSSSCTLASQSQFSSDVDRWLRGSSVESTGVQHSRFNLVQRSTLATTASLDLSSIWYVLMMALSLCSGNVNCLTWRYSPITSTVLNKAELLIAQVCAVYEKIRNHIRGLVRDEVATELFACAMDVVVVVYVVGFLILSMYQASVFG